MIIGDGTHNKKQQDIYQKPNKKSNKGGETHGKKRYCYRRI